MASGRHRRAKGFTLIELLIVVAIVALLASICVPSVARAVRHARMALCLSNLRQLAAAATDYAVRNREQYPIAYGTEFGSPKVVYHAWDFTTSKDWSCGAAEVRPGVLWDGCDRSVEQLQQCPSFEGADNWFDDPYTGYNYNTSYIGGHGFGASAVPSARTWQVTDPTNCALFGDGEYAGGANKFMRSPWASPTDRYAAGTRAAGTQGFRHLGRTCVSFCDGRAVAWPQRCTDTYPHEKRSIAPGTGFLTPDNSVYDLE